MDITVVNWAKYQGASKRYEHTQWLRLDNHIWMHPVWDALDGLEFKALIFLLCQVSQKGNKDGRLTLNFQTLERLSGLTEKVMHETVEKASRAEIGFLTVSAPCAPGECTVSAPGVPGERTVLRNETIRNDTKRSISRKNARVSELGALIENAYKAYPRKVGKTKGVQKALRDCSTPEDVLSLGKAIECFKKYLSAAGTEPQYIPHFSTFMSSWRDWLDPETGTSQGPPKRSLADMLREEFGDEGSGDTGSIHKAS